MVIKRRPSFNSTSFLAKVGKGQSVGKYRKGQVIFSQGDAGDAVFYVHRGKVKVTVVSEQGKEAVVADRRYTKRLPGKTSFTEEFFRSKNSLHELENVINLSPPKLLSALLG